ncbi:hypothetical protein D9M70_568510 [compost metagenome]
MGAVAVVAPAEQRGRLVQQQRLQAAQVVGNAVDILFHVIFPDVLNLVGLELHFLPTW